MDTAFFHNHGARCHWAFEAASAQDLNDTVAVNGPAQCALDRYGIGLQWLGTLDGGFFFHKNGIRRDPTGAGFLHVQADLAFTTQMAMESAFNAR
jgi:hypothetical protein